MATCSPILAWEIPWTEEPWWATVHEVTKESDMTQRLNNNDPMNANAGQLAHFTSGPGMEMYFSPMHFHTAHTEIRGIFMW